MTGNPPSEQLAALLRSSPRIAVVGFSASPGKDAHEIPRFLIERDYDVVPVNPTASEILGRKAFPTLDAVPGDIDIVSVFRPSADVPPIADAAIAKRARCLWMQTGIRNEEAARRAREAGLLVVQDACVRVAVRLLGR